MHQRRLYTTPISVLGYYFLVAIIADVLFNVGQARKGVHGAGSSVPGLDDADVSAVTAPRHTATSIPPAAAPLAKRQILMCT